LIQGIANYNYSALENEQQATKILKSYGVKFLNQTLEDFLNGKKEQAEFKKQLTTETVKELNAKLKALKIKDKGAI
jgi:hypothetical protein